MNNDALIFGLLEFGVQEKTGRKRELGFCNLVFARGVF
jgi:hypothetical protein